MLIPQTNARQRSRWSIRRWIVALQCCLWCLATATTNAAPPLAAEPSAAEIVTALTALENEAVRISPQTPLQARTSNLALTIGGVFQGVINPYAEDHTRYLAVELVVANPSTEAGTLDVSGIALRSGGKILRWQDRPDGMDGYSFQAGREHIAIREVQPPDSLSIPAGGVTSTWLLFAGLEPGGFIPELILTIPAEPLQLQLDVGLFERARLRLRTERIGPADCLGMVSIGGSLNTVNAAALVAALEAFAAAGVHRAVIVFDEAAGPLSQYLTEWLQQARQPNPYQQQFKQMPVFPSTLRELHLVAPSGPGGDVTTNVHRQVGDAVAAALRTAFTAAPVEEVLRALRSEHPAVRAAALRYGAERLRPEQWSIVRRFLDVPEPEVRLAALTALAAFSAPEAIDLLAGFAQSPDGTVAAVAIRSLASSRFPAAHQALARLIREARLAFDDQRVAILAAFPRPEWNQVFLELTTATDSKVQQSALQALARLGDEQLLAVLAQGLQSPEARVREEAFQRLSDMESREADELALDFALTWLKTEPPSASIKLFLERVRDQRAVPLLVRYLDAPEGVRRGVIELLAAIGDQTVAAELARRYPQFSTSEQALTLQSLQSLDPKLARPLAASALLSEDVTLTQRAVQCLQADGSDEAVAALADALHRQRGQPEGSEVNFLCAGLGGIGTAAARDVLVKERKSPDELTRRAAQQGLLVLWNQSPARELVSQAEQELRLVNALKQSGDRVDLGDGVKLTPEQRQDLATSRLLRAKELLTSAERIDPQFPDLALQQGVLLELEGNAAAAVDKFRRSIELNSESVEAHIALGNGLYKLERFSDAVAPLQYAFENDASKFRHQWLTSWALALVRLGQLETAVELLREHASKFPEEPIFEYNQACIYGRAVEALRRDPTVPPDDPRITVFSEEAVRLLHDAFSHRIEAHSNDADMYSYMRADPDLAPLHDVSGFRKFAELDLPEDQRKKTPPLEPAAPAVEGDALQPL